MFERPIATINGKTIKWPSIYMWRAWYQIDRTTYKCGRLASIYGATMMEWSQRKGFSKKGGVNGC